MSSALQYLILSLSALGLLACGQANGPVFHADTNPTNLSDWGVLNVKQGHLIPAEGTQHYAVNAPLFTDYAHKLRTIWTPEPAKTLDNGQFDFVDGTVISKTFYYPAKGEQVALQSDAQPDAIDLEAHRLVETRLLVRRAGAWDAVSYVWNEDGTEAHLKRTGAVVPLTLASAQGMTDFAYIVPNENQCASCHASNATTKTLHPLGAVEGQIKNRGALTVAGILKAGTDQGQVDWADITANLDDRARSYLAANCAHCHNPVGPADTSGLDLSLAQMDALKLGACKPPIAAGPGTGGHKFDIDPGAPDSSILLTRMDSDAPAVMMPELGRSLIHAEGVALIRDWIADMEGGCS